MRPDSPRSTKLKTMERNSPNLVSGDNVFTASTISEPFGMQKSDQRQQKVFSDPSLPPLIKQKSERRQRQRERQKIFNPIDLSEEFESPMHPKSNDTVDFINASLENNYPIFYGNLSSEERRLLIDSMMVESVPAETAIIQQGEAGDYFYIVEEGQIRFEVNNECVGSCERGGTFGELALLLDCPRAASCIADTDCRLWKLGRKTYRYMIANSTTAQQKITNAVLRKVSFLAELDNQDLLRITDALTPVSFSNGECIINKGTAGEVFYIIREGTVKIHDVGLGDSPYVDQTLGPGDFFGERALLTGDPRVASITATSSCTCLCLSRDKFNKVLGPLQEVMDAAVKKRSLLGVPLFCNSHFESHELARLTDLIVERTFQKGTVLAEKGKPTAPNLYIIRSGVVAVANDDGIINTLEDADYFGDKFLKEEKVCGATGVISKQTITVQTETVCGVLSRQDIERVVGNISRLGQPLPPKLHKHCDETICLKDLKKRRILGAGMFGKVWLVSHEETGAPYALKQLSKRVLVDRRQVAGVIREKNILCSLDHPFWVNLVSTFRDDNSLYILLKLVQGGELYSVIHTDTHDGIPNDNARFYAACILESLSHLHQRSVGYRDLKPENVLIDEEGYCVMVDLGFAKSIVDKTFTMCGTPEYIAPEVILCKGYGKGVDYWAFGVLIYEMLAGDSPFYDEDKKVMFKRIMNEQYSLPSDGLVPELAQDLIKKLLVRGQADRLGCLSRADRDVRDHAWFQPMDVDQLLQKQIPAPWIPAFKDPLDATHFDDFSDLEKESIADNDSKSPLSFEEHKKFEDF